MKSQGAVEDQKRQLEFGVPSSALPLSLGRALNFVDRLYLFWFTGLGVLIGIFHHRLDNWQNYLLLHVLCVWVVLLLASAAEQSRVAKFLHDWYSLALFIVAFEETSRLSFLIVDGWRDAYILRFEELLFSTPPTVWLNQFASPVVTEVLEIGYFSYFLLLMIVGGTVYNRPGKREFRQVMTASVLAYLSCYLFFILFPTEGPAHTQAHLHTVELRGGPFHWAVLLIQRNAGVHGNAFPSSHVAAGVVALIFAWKYERRLGAWLTPLVVLLCISAVYDRYHYASDVIAGAGIGVLCSIVIMTPERLPAIVARAERR
ncbi:MAG TPA: phosphatase PAP2 family protein [Terriglobales bacterium]|nr:phosphatase PAP2 family protein [Terriglobales bacterium]